MQVRQAVSCKVRASAPAARKRASMIRWQFMDRQSIYYQLLGEVNQMDNNHFEGQKEQFFINQMESISKEEVGGMLKCKLCGGLLRFAHTLVECGHTFCQQCIFEHIHSFKGKRPEVKCPECHGPIDPPFSRSVMKDIFKQNLVDTVEPSYKETEKILIDRISKLFPNYKLDFLLDQFNYSSETSNAFAILDSNRKKHEKSRIMSGLANVVKEKLGMTFQKFVQEIQSKDSFDKLVEKVGTAEKTDNEPIVIEIRPQSDRDFNFIGINSKIKLPNPEVSKIKKYLEKRLLIRLKDNAELAREVVRSDCNQVNPQVILYLLGHKLEEGESLIGADQPIFYTFRI